MTALAPLQIVFATFAVLSFSLGIVEVGLECAVETNFRDRSTSGTGWPANTDGLYKALYYVPAHLYEAVNALIKASGGLAIVTAVVCVAQLVISTQTSKVRPTHKMHFSQAARH